MTTALTTLDHSNPALMASALTRLEQLLTSPPNTQMQALPKAIEALSTPADVNHILGRVAVLLEPYFEKSTLPAVREAMIEDWVEALKDYPRWAIDKAARWWKSDENPHRHRKPVEGDIVERVKAEMTLVRAAKLRMELFNRQGVTHG